MRSIILTLFALVAFAANSFLNRWALLDADTGPISFSVLRLFSGAVLLWFLVVARSSVWWPAFKPLSAISLFVYATSFSLAYVSLDVGLGALVLFGGVQITLFLLAVMWREEIDSFRILGATISFLGLCFLLMPSSIHNLNFYSLIFMLLAAMGWGLYTFKGHSSSDPLLETAQNFVWATPLALVVYAIMPDALDTKGAILAIVSGAVTSGIGYAVWYAVLPSFKSTTAAILQLSVPLIAAFLGYLFLAEALTWKLGFATGLVILGAIVGLSYRRPKPFN